MRPHLGSAEADAQRTGDGLGLAAHTLSRLDAFVARAQRGRIAQSAAKAAGSSRVETFARIVRAPTQKSEFHVWSQFHAPTPNQAMQRTASKLACYVLSVCHLPFTCVETHAGLAVADLVSG